MSPPGTAAPRIARGFDRLAPFYDTLADLAFVGRIHASQTLLLPQVPMVRRALVVGGGTGRFLAALLDHDPTVRAVSIDASEVMTRRTAARLAKAGHDGRAELRIGGLERLGPDERFDLIATHCFLDLFEDAELFGVLDSLDRALEPGGHWLFSDFRQKSISAMLYPFFRLTCGIAARALPDFDRAFDRLSLKEVVTGRVAGGILQATLFKK